MGGPKKGSHYSYHTAGWGWGCHPPVQPRSLVLLRLPPAGALYWYLGFMKSRGDQVHIGSLPVILTNPDPDTPFLVVFITEEKTGTFWLLTYKELYTWPR